MGADDSTYRMLEIFPKVILVVSEITFSNIFYELKLLFFKSSLNLLS